MTLFEDFSIFARELFETDAFIPLHEPRFAGREKEYVLETIDSTFVSSVGKFVDQFELDLAAHCQVDYAVATSNGTSALHIALIASGVTDGDEVISQSLTFVATCNAISYCRAVPIFVDVSLDSMGMSAASLEAFLSSSAQVRDGECFNRASGRRIKACVPMHTFGMPVREIQAIKALCDDYFIELVEDAAESLGSTLVGRPMGSFGRLAAVSFNGNKIVTTGGGGAVLTDNEDLAKQIKHLTTTAKIPHKWHYDHDWVGYNYRMPNLNAALGCAQLENLSDFVKKKRALAEQYDDWFAAKGIQFHKEYEGARSNYWLNAIILDNVSDRDKFLQATNDVGVMTRPAWRPMHLLNMFNECERTDLKNTEWLAERVVNIPSSVI